MWVSLAPNWGAELTLPSGIQRRINYRVLTSLAITGSVVFLFLSLGRASAVLPSINCQHGESETTCEMILEIGAERIPLESLEVNITGPVDFQAQFDPFGQNIQGDPRIQITLLSARNDGFGQGYGFGFGQLHGFDQLTGYEFDFGFGEGFGLGFGFKHLSEQEQPRYGSDINKEDLPPGEYSVKFIVHTGNEIKPTF